MSYTANVPITGQTLGNTLVPINSNFSVLNVSNSVNHEAYSSANQGKHKFLQMPEQAGSIGQVGVPLPPTTAANEAGFYAKVGTNPAETNMVFRAENNGFEYQLTKSISASTALFCTTPNGWNFLPGGMIIQWGEVTNPGTSGTVTFATANINFPVAVFSIQLQLYHSSSANESATINQSTPPTTAQFLYRTTSSGASTVLKWIAIGN